MTLHDHRGIATWAEVTRKANALDDIACQIANYIHPDSGITHEVLVSKIIQIIETKTNFVFIRCFGQRQPEFMMGAGEGKDTPPLPQGNQPPKPQETEEATKDNDLTTGHSTPGDGGDDNAKEKK